MPKAPSYIAIDAAVPRTIPASASAATIAVRYLHPTPNNVSQSGARIDVRGDNYVRQIIETSSHCSTEQLSSHVWKDYLCGRILGV
jgi:hypothetical protein